MGLVIEGSKERFFVRKAWSEPQYSQQEKAVVGRKGWFFPWMERGWLRFLERLKEPLQTITLMVISAPSFLL